MPKAFAWILAAVAVLVVALFGLAIGVALTTQDPPQGALDTDLEGVTVVPPPTTTTEPEPEPPPEPVGDRRCWRTFGADPRRSLGRPDATLGLPARRFTWTRGLGTYIEFPPVYCEGELYVNGFSGTTFALDAETGRVRWTRRGGGTLPSSPAIDGPRGLVASQSGTVTGLDRRTGREEWTTYLKRDAFRYESFYASPSSDGARLYSLSRAGTVYALDASSGRVVWQAGVGGLGDTTPAVAQGRVFAGGFDGRMRAFRATTGDEIWSTDVGGRLLGAPGVIGPYVFFSTLEKRTFALRVEDGSIAWRIRLGKYTPGIATERTYFLSLNGRLIATPGRDVAKG